MKRNSTITHFFSKKSKEEEPDTQPQVTKPGTDFNELTKLQVQVPIAPSSLGQNKCLDIKDCIGKSFVDTERYRVLNQLFVPHSSFKFPSVAEGNHKRSFQSHWLSLFPWLAYSPSENGAYCKVCVLFGPSSAGRGDQALGKLVNAPLNRYKDALADFRYHEKTDYHNSSTVSCNNYKRVVENKCPDISCSLDTARNQRIAENRSKLVGIVETIILCGRQNIPLRGHRDDGVINCEEPMQDALTETKFRNEGNFREILKYRVRGGDVILKEHLEKAAKNAMFTSKTTQNQIIECCSEIIQEKVLGRFEGRFFSILVDETTDVAGNEQMCFCVRYYYKGKVEERFLKFILTTDTAAEPLSKQIIETIHSLGLDVKFLRGQGYDGASNMSGDISGVKTRILQIQPLAKYTHCSSHCLNLCLSKACTVADIRNAVDLIKSVINFFCSAKRKHQLLNKIREIYPETKACKLRTLCETRWTERHESFQLFNDLFLAIHATLDEIACSRGNYNKDAAVFVAAICRFQFIVAFKVLASVLSSTVSLSRQLQTVDIDLFQACNMISVVQRALEAKRQKFDTIFSEAVKLADELGVNPSTPRNPQNQKYRSNVPSSSIQQHYERNIYIPFLDTVLVELKSRFSDHFESVFRLQTILPSHCCASPSASFTEDVLSVVEEYQQDLPGTKSEIEGEFSNWVCYWKRLSSTSRPDSAIDTLLYLEDENETKAFPNMYVMLELLVVLPVTTATAERTFSVLRRLKTWLRNKQSEERLTGLALMHINRDIPVTTEEVIQKFALKNPRRMVLI